MQSLIISITAILAEEKIEISTVKDWLYNFLTYQEKI